MLVKTIKFLALGTLVFGSPLCQAAGKPNILFIVADDLGFSDLHCYGGEIETPNLDALAQNGVKFSQFYNGTRCCPSRASFLTGLYAHQAGIGHMTEDRKLPAYRGNLSKNAVTMAEVLRTAGYRTGMVGKWHLTPFVKPGQPDGNWPNNRGFDFFYGTLPGHGSLWDPKGLYENNTPISAGKNYFYTDAIAEKSIQFIKTRQDKPFFLYVPFTAPHYPLHAREKTIQKYRKTYQVGWDKIRQQRHARLIAQGLIPKSTKLAPRDPASIPWEDEKNQRWQAHRMQVFAAMVDEMDQAIGKIIATLKQTGQFENTLIVFISDNGGSNEGHLNNTIERLHKPWTSGMIPKKSPAGKPVVPGDIPNLDLGPATTYGSYGPRWASVSNSPFRRHKSWVHEGGIATPCIMHWPEKLTSYGTVANDLTHITDLMPTFVAAANASYPTKFNGHLIPPMEGQSLLPTLTGNKVEVREVAWEHEGNRAYRIGSWKIVSEFPGSWSSMYPYKNKGQWELYNLATDRSEINNLAKTHPKKLQQMIIKYNAWAKRVKVVEWSQLEKNHPVESTQ
ncbi:sulfatase [Oceaniferula spumae]|uniref:Sulfatase n=1 Tax=Oceaniferula spumae TaxID=2979115 RepID=A0AAT9FRJ5_9BACT